MADLGGAILKACGKRPRTQSLPPFQHRSCLFRQRRSLCAFGEQLNQFSRRRVTDPFEHFNTTAVLRLTLGFTVGAAKFGEQSLGTFASFDTGFARQESVE